VRQVAVASSSVTIRTIVPNGTPLAPLTGIYGRSHERDGRPVIDWWIPQLSPRAPGLWLLLSLLATVALSVGPARKQPAWAQWAWYGHWLLIPYFGLLLGGLSPRLMGLANLDWARGLSLGVGLIFIVAALLVLVRVTVELPSPHEGRSDRDARGDRRTTFSPANNRGGWQTVLFIVAVAGAEQLHWSFLRGSLWEIMLTMPDPPDLPAYWAIWIAALIVLGEAALRRPAFVQWLSLLTILATTSILFFYTSNYWLCWILHGFAAMILTSHTDARRVPAAGADRLQR